MAQAPLCQKQASSGSRRWMRQPWALPVCMLLLAVATTNAETIVAWNFNSQQPDDTTTTGTTAPSNGAGTVTLIGGVTAVFSSGDSNSDPGGGTDNSGWNTSGYPAVETGSRTAGIEFRAGTAGYEHIVVKWSQRNSATASRYCRLQYSVNGRDFLDAQVVEVVADSVFLEYSVDLSPYGGTADNPLFAWRLVTEFESAAVGSGAAAYIATRVGSTYSSNGTIRLDSVRVEGGRIAGGNLPPSITSIADQAVRLGEWTPTLNVTVGDTEDLPTKLSLSGESSDASIIAAVVVAGTGATRTVRVHAGTKPGEATITLLVTDTGGRSTRTTFLVTVLTDQTPPFISKINGRRVLWSEATPEIHFQVGDAETPAAELQLSAYSGNPDLVSPGAFQFSGSGSNRTVRVWPTGRETGICSIQVVVSDGVHSGTTTFPLMIAACDGLVLEEPFLYADGSLVTNSGGWWKTRSGVAGQAAVKNGGLELSSTQTEDPVAPLVGGPYETGRSNVLYTAFLLKATKLPRYNPGVLSSFVEGNTLRGRVYVGTSNTLDGFYRLWVGNGTNAPSEVYVNLSLNSTYRIVTRYDLDTASTAIWINPRLESDTHVGAYDVQPPIPVTSFGFRQDTDLGGTMIIDELKVAMSFADVMSPRLHITQYGDVAVIKWREPGYVLEVGQGLTAPFNDQGGASSPVTNPITGTGQFFRLRLK